MKAIIESLKMIALGLIIGIGVLVFFTFIWLTDPAYGATYEQVLDLNESDYLDLLQVVSKESKDDVYVGQQAVVEVIGNRILDERFPDTCYKVLSQKKQFSTWKNRASAAITQEQIDAVESVRFEESSVMQPYIDEAKTNGSISPKVVPTDYIYFCTPEAYKKVGRRYMHNIIQIGGHVFGTSKL